MVHYLFRAFFKAFQTGEKVGWHDKLHAISFLGDLKKEGVNLEIYSDHARFSDVLNIYEYRIDNKRKPYLGLSHLPHFCRQMAQPC